MSRNDAILYTGQTSASRRSEAIQKRKREKVQKQSVLTPVEALIFELLDAERDRTKLELLASVDHTTPDVDVKAMITAINLYGKSITAVKDRIATTLRNRERPEAQDE